MDFPIYSRNGGFFGNTDDEWYGMVVTEVEGHPAITLRPVDFKNPNFFNSRQPRAVVKENQFNPKGVEVFNDYSTLIDFYARVVFRMSLVGYHPSE